MNCAIRVVCLAALAAACNAASLSGRVYDPSGGAVPRASVTLRNTQTGETRAATTNDPGEFVFPAVAAGAYELEVAAPGFARYRRAVPLQADAAVNINPVLRLGQISERLEIVGQGRPLGAQPAGRRVRAGGRVQPPRMLNMTRPAYPPEAKAAGVQGTVLVQAVVSKDGSVGDVVVMSGADPSLAKAAGDAVRAWRYAPAMLNGQPVEVDTAVELVFRLEP